MAGGTPEHGQIAMNFGRAVGNALEKAKKSCIIYSRDVKVHISSVNRTFYPDASIVCRFPQTSEIDNQAIINPILILEILSANTVASDRGAKFAHYRELPTLREYVLISQSEPLVDTFYRTEDTTWDIHTSTQLTEKVNLKSIGCIIQMSDIYRLVPGIDKAT